MSIDRQIKEAFERHAPTAERRPDAWAGVELAIARSHRRRVFASSLGAAAAIVAAAIVVPLVSTSKTPEHPIGPGPVSTAGWATFRSEPEGFEVSHPKDWTARRDASSDVTSIVPNGVARSGGKPLFSIDMVTNPGNHTDFLALRQKAPEFHVTIGKLDGGYDYVRVEHRASNGNVSVTYYIDWTTPLCAPGAPCPRPAQGTVLDTTISAATPALWTQYGQTAEQVAQTIHAIPKQSTVPAPTVVTKIPVPAFDLAIGADAIWALQRSEISGHAGKLFRIDPATNRPTASIDVGVWPTAVAANADGVWVANGPLDGYAAPFPSQDSVMRIDPRTNRLTASFRVRHPQDVAIGPRGSSILVTAVETDGTVTLITIDPQTNTIASRRTLPGTDEFAHIAVGEGPASDRRDVIWVTTIPASTGGPDRTFLSRIDADGKMRTFDAPGGTGSGVPAAVGFGSVWLGVPGETSANGLARIDVSTGAVLKRIVLPDGSPVGMGSIATGEGSVWALGGRGLLWRVDPIREAQAGDPLTIGDVPPVIASDVVYGFSSVWVASGDGKIWRLEP